MDAGLMTWYAARWTNVPAMSTCQSSVLTPKKTIGPNSQEYWDIQMTECETQGPSGQTIVNYIEQVQVIISLNADRRGDMEIFLLSPSKTRTQILPVDLLVLRTLIRARGNPSLRSSRLAPMINLKTVSKTGHS